MGSGIDPEGPTWHLHDSGAEAVIEGCTEIALLVGQEHTAVPLFDPTRIHASQAVTEALK